MEILEKESPPYSTVKEWAAEFKRERERALRMMDGLAAPKIPLLIKMSRNTLVMCDRVRDVRGIASEVDICFGSVQSIVTEILGMSKVLARYYRPRILTDDQKRTFSVSGVSQ